MSNGVTTTKQQAVQKVDRPLPEKFAYLQTIRDRVDEIEAILKYGLLKKGVDFMKIPGTPKPTLLKPGAEILCQFYHYDVEYEIDDSGTDLAAGIYNYKTTCKGYKTDKDGIRAYAGMGMGFCSSQEGKYRYRWVSKWDLPAKWQAYTDTYQLGDAYKAEYGEAAVKLVRAKGGKAWAKFRIENDNSADLGNTILKMSNKRALIGFVTLVTGCDRIFVGEEDVEVGDVNKVDEVVEASDVIEGEVVEVPEEKPAPKAKAEPKQTTSKETEDAKFISEVAKLCKELGWTKEGGQLNKTMGRYPNCKHPTELSEYQRKDLVNHLLDLVANPQEKLQI